MIKTTSFQQGETVPILLEVYNLSDNLVNGDTVIISVKDIEGTIIIDGVAMINNGLGLYSYNYNSDSDADIGLWKVIIKVTLNSVITIINGSFRIVP